MTSLISTSLAFAATETSETKSPVQEERKDRPFFSPEAYVERIDQAVGGLTADQKTKIKGIVTKTMEKMREAEASDRREIMQSQRDEIRAVLTPEQQTKFDAMPRGRREWGKDKKSDEANPSGQ